MTKQSDELEASTMTLKQGAVDTLRAMILSGQLRPGDPLRERDLSAQLGISRTPLREALNRLQSEGLVQSQPHRGYSVAVIDLKTATQLLDLRRLLDSHAASLAADEITDAGIAELNEIMARLAHFEENPNPSMEDLADEFRTGMRIHEIIAKESGNPFLAETLNAIYGRIYLLIWVDLLWVDRWDLTRAEHREIVSAVLDRDKERASRAAGSHVERSRDDLQRVINAQSLLHGSPWSRSGDKK